jgi:hypothetical protein
MHGYFIPEKTLCMRVELDFYFIRFLILLGLFINDRAWPFSQKFDFSVLQEI